MFSFSYLMTIKFSNSLRSFRKYFQEMLFLRGERFKRIEINRGLGGKIPLSQAPFSNSIQMKS